MQENGGIEMVIYEIGSMESSEESCLQFALALVLKNELHLVQDITIYDQNLSASELKVINHFQCQCHSNTTVNKVERPTLFFINGCKFYLWNNILEANFMSQELNKIVILGSPLKEWVPSLPRNFGEIRYASTIMENNPEIIKEFPVWLRTGQDFDLSQPQWWSFHIDGATIDPHQIALRQVFYNLSWHFFDVFVNPFKITSIHPHPWKALNSTPPPPPPNINRKPCSSQALDLTDPTADEIKIREAIEASIIRLEASSFYKKFTETIKCPEFVQHFERLKLTQQQLTGNSENFKLRLVLYGVGKIEKSEYSRLQFSLVILLQRDFDWVGELTAFEPKASHTEIKVLQGFGCDWITNNEKGRRFVHKPTLLFMPAVPLFLHDHLISSNWGFSGLNKMIILGKSFKTTTSMVPQMTYIFQVLHRDGIVFEVPVNGQGCGPPDDCSHAFQFYSWHFFNSSANSCDQDKISVPNCLPLKMSAELICFFCRNHFRIL
ncbi:hypothetical protein SUGI_0641780 [Cryptomeria japonica]|nr:hypothetical protein SUGI_0641780 [Cryptomeria japonica]